MKMRGKQIGLLPALLTAVLSFGGFVGIASIVSNNSAQLTPVSLANDGGEDGGDNENEDENKDENDDKQSESEKKAKEVAKKKAEREREDAKKSIERSGKYEEDKDNESNDDRVNGVKVRGDGSIEDENKNDDASENEEGDDNGMFKDRTKTLSKLQEELAKAEEEILKKQAEGIDVTAALARLAEARAKVTTVGSAFDNNDLVVAKDLAQEVKKLTHFALNDDLHSAKKVAEGVSKVEKRITQAYGKITLLEAVGGDGGTAKSALGTLEADLATLKATIATGSFDLTLMESSLKTLERKVKVVKSSVEGAIYALGGTDSKYDDEYEDESHDIAENLNDVADIEDDNVGRVIRGIGEDHKDSAKKVAEKVAEIDQHNIVLQTLFGTKQSDLNDLEQEIVASKARTAMLEQAAGSVADLDVKIMLLDQIETLKAQTAKLETFVSGQRGRLSAFGWFFNLFSK